MHDDQPKSRKQHLAELEAMAVHLEQQIANAEAIIRESRAHLLKIREHLESAATGDDEPSTSDN